MLTDGMHMIQYYAILCYTKQILCTATNNIQYYAIGGRSCRMYVNMFKKLKKNIGGVIFGHWVEIKSLPLGVFFLIIGP